MNVKPVSGINIEIIKHGMREKSTYCAEYTALAIRKKNTRMNKLQMRKSTCSFRESFHGIVMRLRVPTYIQRYSAFRYLQSDMLSHH